MLNHPLVQFGISREGDVLFLHRGIHQHFGFFGLIAVKFDGYLEDLFYTFLTDPLSGVYQIRGVTGKLPLEYGLPAKKLIVGVFNPSLDNRFVRQIVELFQDQQRYHQSDWLCRSSAVVVKI